MKNPQILIVQLGSQYADLIGRSLRELNVRSAILPPGKAARWLSSNKPKGIIFSGSEASVNDTNAPQPPEEALKLGVPILGICYGFQWLAKLLGGNVQSGTGKGNYGRTPINFDTGDPKHGGLFANVFGDDGITRIVWASHGDIVASTPPSFNEIAWPCDSGLGLMGMANQKRRIWGVQFHPEVKQTSCGRQILSNFVFGIAGCEKDWNPTEVVADVRKKVLTAVGKEKAIIGFSGGVDSTTLAAILSPAMGERLLGFTIDAGQLREGELEEIRSNAVSAGICSKIVRAQCRFLPVLSRLTDAEKKRIAFRREYESILQEQADRFGAKFVLQGSLAPDFIESGQTGGAIIVSHHNVGLSFKGLNELHPLKDLFKYEVRSVAEKLGLPKSVRARQPFPGPGLFVRIVGEPVTVERLSLVRWADAQVRRILEERGEYNKISQLVVALLCVNTGGVKGDARAYKPAIGVRGLVTADYMTGIGYQIGPEVRREITRALPKHSGIGRVWYDEIDKPPGRTEFE